MTPGVEVTVRGIGRCRVQRVVEESAGQVRWVDVTDPRNGGCRSVTPDRISRVHRIVKGRVS